MTSKEYMALLVRRSHARATWLDRNYGKSRTRGFFRNPEGNGFTCMYCRRHRDGLRAMQRHIKLRTCFVRRAR